jgi:hypothetical protein
MPEQVLNGPAVQNSLAEQKANRLEQEESIFRSPVAGSVVAANGDTFDFEAYKEWTVLTLKGVIEATSGVSCGRQQLYVLDDNRLDVEDLSLKNNEIIADVTKYAASQTELKLLMMTDIVPPEWDRDWIGEGLLLSEENTCATCQCGGSEGMSIRSKEALDPQSGVHCFEYTYSHMDRKGSMGGCYMVGVALASVPKALFSERGFSYGEGGGLFGTKKLWVLEDSGPVWTEKGSSR